MVLFEKRKGVPLIVKILPFKAKYNRHMRGTRRVFNTCSIFSYVVLFYLRSKAIKPHVAPYEETKFTPFFYVNTGPAAHSS